MARTPRFHPLFDEDVIQGAIWYEKNKSGLGVDFTFRIESAIAAIITDPERRSDRQYGLRYWPVERFPHLILYDVTETEILLFGVMHPSQMPDRWVARRS